MTAKELVKGYLKANNGWVASHEIESLSIDSDYMASNLSRRARELAQSGVLERKRIGKIEYFRYNTHRPLTSVEVNNLLKEMAL